VGGIIAELPLLMGVATTADLYRFSGVSPQHEFYHIKWPAFLSTLAKLFHSRRPNKYFCPTELMAKADRGNAFYGSQNVLNTKEAVKVLTK